MPLRAHVEFHHRIADRGSRGENDAPAPGDLIHVAALHIEVAGLLRFGLGDAAHVPHFRKRREVFIIMGFINKNAVNAQFLKRDQIILAALVVQAFQFLFDAFPGALQLLDGKTIPVLCS